MIQLTCNATYPPEALPSIGCAAKFVNPLGIGFVLNLTHLGYLSSHLGITLAIIRPEGWISVTTAWVLELHSLAFKQILPITSMKIWELG